MDGVDGIQGVSGLAVSLDGRNLYAAGKDEGRIVEQRQAVFIINSSTGHGKHRIVADLSDHDMSARHGDRGNRPSR